MPKTPPNMHQEPKMPGMDHMPWIGDLSQVPPMLDQDFFEKPDTSIYGDADEVPSMTYSQDDPAFAGNSPGRMVGNQPK
jgi:hypothetical protein